MKETIFSLIRAFAVGIGAYLIGHNTELFGNVLDANLWDAIIGGVIGLGAGIWGYVDKTSTEEALESAIKSFVSLIGGLMVASGKIKAEYLVSILGMITVLLPTLLSYINRKKLKKVDTGQLTIVQSKGNVTNSMRTTVIAPSKIINKPIKKAI